MGDALDDDWWEEKPQFVQRKEGGGAVRKDNAKDDEGEEETGAKNKKKGEKRRRADEDGEDSGTAAPAEDDADSASAAKNDKKKKKKKKTNNFQAVIADKHDKQKAALQGSAEDVSKFFWGQFVKAHEGKLSAVELDELIVDELHFRAPPSHTASGNAAELASFITAVVPTGKRGLDPANLKVKGSPKVLIVSSGAIRCLELIKNLTPIKGEGKIAKLFARHMKVPEQAAFLQVNTCLFAVGTPHRVGSLLKNKSLLWDHVDIVLIDASWVDEKQRTIFEQKEIATELMDLLKEHIFPACIGGKVKIAVF